MDQKPMVCCAGKLMLASFPITCHLINAKRGQSWTTALKVFFPCEHSCCYLYLLFNKCNTLHFLRLCA